MAQDELTIHIPKEHWPKNVLRMLTPCLRKLGDSHGHIIIAAQPARGALLLKGPSEKIDGAKAGLRALITEHFPEAEMPAELRQEAEQVEEEVEEAAQTDAYGGEPLDVEEPSTEMQEETLPQADEEASASPNVDSAQGLATKALLRAYNTKSASALRIALGAAYGAGVDPPRLEEAEGWLKESREFVRLFRQLPGPVDRFVPGKMALWEVVGGAGHGGVLVRSGPALSDDLCEARLATGAVVKKVEERDGRLCYELVRGDGPATGWVSMQLRGRDLLVKAQEQEPSRAPGRGRFSEWASQKTEVAVVEEASTGSEVEVAAAGASDSGESTPVMAVAEKEPTEDEREAFRQYTEKFGECRDGSNPGYSRKSFPWFTGKAPQGEKLSSESLQAALSYRPIKKRLAKANLTEVDSDREEIPLCTRCSMPVGEFAYQGREGKDTCVHTECMAQVLMKEAQREDEHRTTRENNKKLKNRREYNIGWRMDSVPSNARLAERMGCRPAPQGLCCLVLDEASKTVRVAATLEPSASVNLEYLLLALKVRKSASREPLFSLDPIDPKNMESSPQKKVFEPSWLAGTSAGDVMFQADYFLKELALGEYNMPVLGMMSVFDWSEMGDKDKTWSGREWFVVKKAEVRMAEDRTLIPHVRMGVEAREQILTPKGLEDAPVTVPTHPLKKFAEAFTRHFDLIAERKSVIFHLRELAKASVMAKYLVDSKARIDPSWYRLADEIVKGAPPEPYMEIPQLWNMRGNSRIKLQNGRLIDMVTGGQSKLQAIYGGVEFGLDRFELAQRHALQGQPTGMQLGQSGRPMFMPQRFQLGQREMPQGVDLNLDKFSLSTEERFRGKLPPCSGDATSLEGRTTLGKAFLSSLRQKSWTGMKMDDQKLLLNIFDVPQCDRVEEGDAFTPPDPNLEYIVKVRSLVGEERGIRDRRRVRFADKNFVMANPGNEFPRSWTSRFQVEHEGRISYTAPTKFGLVKLDVDETFKCSLLQEVIPKAVAEFDQVTEDGVAFRIYKLGSLEVRTIQEVAEAEMVHVVFSSRAASWETKGSKAQDVLGKEKLSRCRVYVEAMEHEACNNYYIVLETTEKTVIVTERMSDGSLCWLQNPHNLEDRNSLAKLLFTADCKEGMRMSEVRQHFEAQPRDTDGDHRKRYAKALYVFATGRSLKGKWGGSARRYTAPPMRGLGVQALGRSSEFMNVMWLARGSGLRGL
ncbi:unnamed protein product [Symbiodinium sp. CCMP2592]|nr:unnamed protein product [Symbiodinium sp. CCMP2592]